MSAKGKQKIKTTIGSPLYYGRAVHSTILTALNDLSSQQANPTENARAVADMLLDYINIPMSKYK